MRVSKLEPRFVEFIPDTLEQGTIYISMGYATASHKCCCGCGEEVVTPFSPTDWKLTYDGMAVSLWPSIGNWNFACRSHYILRDGRVIEAAPWTQAEVATERLRDKREKARYFGTASDTNGMSSAKNAAAGTRRRSVRAKIIGWFRSR